MRYALVFLLALPSAVAQTAQEPPELQVSGYAGWGGRVSVGDWTPVLIDLDYRGKKDVDIVLSVTWAANFAHQSVENPSLESVIGRSGPVHQVGLSMPSKTRKRVSVTLLTPEIDRTSIWAFAVDARNGKTLARRELVVRAVEPHKRIVAVVGSARPDGLQDANLELASLQPDELPEEWQGYSALTALIWLDGRATEIRGSAQIDALKQWISTGGTFCVARANTVGLAGTAIADLLPVKLGASRELPTLGSGRLPAGPMVVLGSSLRKGALRAVQDEIPIVVESAQDAGRIIFLAADPARDPFVGWAEAGEFWKWLLHLPPPPAAARPEEHRSLRSIGSYALTQQAGRFPDVAAPEIGGLFLLIILYLVVVGPLDYLLLRWLKKMEYTWFTFPGYVAAFTLFILMVGGAFIQRAAHQREIAVVDHYPDSGFVRHRALSAVLAPANVIYRVEEAQPLSSNHAGNDLSFETAEKFSQIQITRTPQKSVDNWLLFRGYTGLALADRCSQTPSPIAYTITGQDNVEVKLTVKNTSTETFESSSLITPRGAYFISSIPPGESQISGSRTSPTLADFVEKEGQRPVRLPAQPDYGRMGMPQYPGGDVNTGNSEQYLNPPVRKALVGLSFPTGSPQELELLTGLARGLQAKTWLDAGGSVLLVWPQKTQAVVRFDPQPSRYTSVTLLRFFQGPPP